MHYIYTCKIIKMEQLFHNLIVQLSNPGSAETQNAMRILNTGNPNDIPTLITIRMQQQPLFFNSMGLFADYEHIERAFAATVPGLNPELWLAFIRACRTFLQQQQPQMQQQQPQMQQQQPQMQQQQYTLQQYPQQQYPQQQYPQQQYTLQQQQSGEAEPVLGPVSPMPRGINMSAARAHEAYIKEMGKKRGGKRSRSNKRGRKSVRGHKKSVHKIRRRKSNHNKRH